MKNLAQCYDLVFGNTQQDLYFYQSFIEAHQPALEIGSGTGRLLLAYLKHGFKVEGIEPNQENNSLLLQKSRSLNLKPLIYSQNLQELNLDKKYKLIYLPLYIFQNIIDRADAVNSLKLIYNHLEKNSLILISIFIPWNDPTGTWEGTWRLRASAVDLQNNEIINCSESLVFDKFEQIQTKQIKYDLFSNNILNQSLLMKLQFRCYSRFELTMMLELAGFKDIEIFGDYALQEASSSSECFIFKAIK